VRDSLNYAVLAWLAIGAARLWVDVRVHGALALRDFAMCYYAVFFFLAQTLTSHAASSRLLHRALLVAFAVLPVVFQIYTRFTDFILGTVRLRGGPLLFYKEDLVASYCFAGFFVFLAAAPALRWWRAIFATMAYVAAFGINSSRAAIMGLLVTSTWWAVARRWTPWKLQALLAPLAIAGLALVALLGGKDFQQSKVYSLYEHVSSMVDFSGTGRYSTDDRRYVGDNNRFRLAWWRSVVEEVQESGPVFGLGFGHDLAERFVRSYELDLGEDFSARSPHSILFSVLGRMGLVGLLLLFWIVGAMAAATWRLARRARTDDAALGPLGWWSVAWVMFTSGCFGVVLEGPMGAVIFWTSLGMANSASAELLAQDETAGEEQPAAGPSLPSPAVSA
jgi:O-antigen ligase